MQYAKGRPRVYTEQGTAMEAVTVRLTKWHERMARKLGGGSVGPGIRVAVEIASVNLPPDMLSRPKRRSRV